MIGVVFPDLERPPLRETDLRSELLVPGGLWSSLRVVGRTTSTNGDLVASARRGLEEGAILLAEEQVAGRGRLGRVWQSPPRAGLAVSVLLRPCLARFGWPIVAQEYFAWLPLLTGVALVQAVRRVCGVDAALKWPNDLLICQRKCAGILAEFVPPAMADRVADTAVVVGVGLNATLRRDELPHSMATSLALEGATCAERHQVALAFLRDLATWYTRWRAFSGDPDRSGLRQAYEEHCATLRTTVRVALPGGGTLHGGAEAIDREGRLVVRCVDGTHTVLAVGDVVHVRPDRG